MPSTPVDSKTWALMDWTTRGAICNKGTERVYLRLDKALATCDWIEKFGDVRVHHLVDSTLDYCALFISNPLAIKRPRS